LKTKKEKTFYLSRVRGKDEHGNGKDDHAQQCHEGLRTSHTDVHQHKHRHRQTHQHGDATGKKMVDHIQLLKYLKRQVEAHINDNIKHKTALTAHL